jgi:hypothetical protein
VIVFVVSPSVEFDGWNVSTSGGPQTLLLLLWRAMLGMKSVGVIVGYGT